MLCLWVLVCIAPVISAPAPDGWVEPYGPADVYVIWKQSPAHIWAKMREIEDTLEILATEVVDAFAGNAGIQKVYKEQGLGALGFDRHSMDGTYHPEYDIVTHDGFWNIVRMIWTVMRYGLVHWGPPCGMFVWLSLGFSGRTKLWPWGNWKRRQVPGSDCSY